MLQNVDLKAALEFLDNNFVKDWKVIYTKLSKTDKSFQCLHRLVPRKKTNRLVPCKLTKAGVVVDQNDLTQEVRWRTIQNTVNGSQKNGPSFVVKDNNDTGVRQIITILQCFAPKTRVVLYSFNIIIIIK